MLKISLFHMNTHTEMFALLITCVIDNTLLKTMSDIDKALLHFIDIMNLVVLLLHLSHLLWSSGFRSVCWVPKVW